MRKKKSVVSKVPNLHFVMIIVVFVMSIVCLVLYHFAPQNKEQLYSTVIIALLGFITGKFTNSFGKPIDPLPPVVDADGDGVPDDEQGEKEENQ